MALAFIDPCVAIGLLVGIPFLLGSPLSTLRWFVPDLTYWLLTNTLLAMLVAGVRLWRAAAGASRHRRGARYRTMPA